MTASLSGFPELLPSQRFVELAVVDRLRTVFELHGFAPVETRAVEPMDSLLRKGDIDKELYVLRRLHADPHDAPDQADALGLHFDLTVPFARYVLENAGHLEFPFRRYQIQKVWRGERPQEGRFREFTQADIDIVGRDVLAVHHDVEIAQVIAEALRSLDFLPALRLQVNNRKLIEGFCLGLGVPDVAAVLRAVDRLDKVPTDVVGKLLRDEAGLSEQQAAQCLALADIRARDSSFVARVRELGVTHQLLDEGLHELAAVIDGCTSITGVTVEVDLRIARGLDYYTGTVFETRMAGFETLGSVCSGGRYDSLASDGRATYPGVGISLGVTRLLIPLLQRGLLCGSRSVPSAVLVALPSVEERARCDAIAQSLRARGVAAEVAGLPQKYGKQIRYAERRGIPFVWFPSSAEPGSGDQVRDIRSGAQAPADPDTWTPPSEDLRPQVLAPQLTGTPEESTS